MRAASLYHLLQLRLRSLAPDCPQACRDGLAELQAALAVTHGRGFFELTWTYRGKPYSLSVVDRAFSFHVAGDTALAAERRGDVTATRARNWQSAAELWQRMAMVSGFAVPDAAFPPALAPPASRPEAAMGAVLWAGVPGAALVAALIAAYAAGPAAGIAVGATVALLGCFAWTLEATHLRERLGLDGLALLAVGALVPLGADWQNGSAVPLLGAVASAAWLERRGMRNAVWWTGVGLLAGLAPATIGWPGSAGALALAFGLLGAAWAAPLKLSRPAALAFAGATLAGLVAVSAFGFRSAPDDASGNWVQIGAWVVTLGLVLPFAAWWVQGSLFHVVPWLGMGALSVAAVAATAASGATAGVLGLAGLASLLTWRLVRGFQQTSGGQKR